MPFLWWLVVIGGPIACAAAGAVTAFLFTVRHYERRLDAAYDQGWRDSAAWFPPSVDAPAEWQPAPASATAQGTLPAPVAAAETLPALPPVHHEGGRHAGRSAPPVLMADLEALGRVRTEFARIRASLGLPA